MKKEPVAIYVLYRADSYKTMDESVVTHKRMTFRLYDGKVTEQSPDDGYLTLSYTFQGGEQSEWFIQGHRHTPHEKLSKERAREVWNSLVRHEWTWVEAHEKVKV